jgi:hypothetical protein
MLRDTVKAVTVAAFLTLASCMPADFALAEDAPVCETVSRAQIEADAKRNGLALTENAGTNEQVKVILRNVNAQGVPDTATEPYLTADRIDSVQMSESEVIVFFFSQGCMLGVQRLPMAWWIKVLTGEKASNADAI